MIVGSGFALFGGLNLFHIPPMGAMGHFGHDIFAPLLLCMAPWGLATSIGLWRAWCWARISMLVFNSLLAVCGALAVVAFLLMPSGGMAGWHLFLLKVGILLVNLIPVAIGVRWFIYFRRNNVRAYFQNPLKTQ